jgi:hypothetical protein
MRNRRAKRTIANVLVAFAIVAVSLLSLLDTRPGAAQGTGERYVTAAATCLQTLGSDSGLPLVEVAIENQSDLTLHVAYVRSFGSAPIREDGPTGLRFEAPRAITVIDVPDGETVTLEAPWAGGELRRSYTIVALVVSSAGIFLPACDTDEVERMTFQNDAPDGDRAAMEESEAIAAEAIGQLEAWHAYSVLYALLHPDAQEAVSFAAMTCWYSGRFGPPDTDDTQTIFSTETTEVASDDWTWAMNGVKYNGSAVVIYKQAVGRSEDAKPEESKMHLVQLDGVWRWFFGGSAEGIAGLATDCELPEMT